MLNFSRITLQLNFNTPTILPRWMGSVFRGGFGEYLRMGCCPNINQDCKKCHYNDGCLFYYSYERETAKKGYAPPTRPIIIVPPFFGQKMEFREHCTLDVDVFLFGAFSKYLPHVLLGMKLLGFAGIGSLRRYDMNRFVIEAATCALSGERIYDGETVSLTKLRTIDVADLNNCTENPVKIGFRTPIILKSSEFPPSSERLLDLIRSRLILYVNEYGDGTKVGEAKCSGEVCQISKHFHRLERRSRRAGARLFEGFTGIAEYSFDELDDVGKWLLNVGLFLGAGPRSAFGCGFLDLKN
jgi:CRISPR/Cas system endoribonuclease Cas6 (RAMP superfamily)